MRILSVAGLAVLLWTLCGLSAAQDWPVYGHDAAGTKFSPLTQINRENIAQLKVAWTYRTGDLFDRKFQKKEPAHEATPIYIDGSLYFNTPFGKVIALDPLTGKPRWIHDTNVDLMGNYGDFASRGVSTWIDPHAKAGAPCQRRIFVAPIDARLIALDAKTGDVCTGFAEIDLTAKLRHGPAFKGEYEETSPPAIINDLVIVGSGIADNNRTDAPSGEVRAFDARTGKLRWTWHPLSASVKSGAANVWSIISTDAARNLVFLPTSSPSPDYYGGLRPGNNDYANSVVALNAKTGKMVWHFQTVHHDLWDYDVASQPLLFDIGTTPAIAIGSKTGNLFILNRETGKPIFGVTERPVPQSDVPGERASPTQPFPTLPKPLVPQNLTAADAWGATDADRKWCEDKLQSLRADGIFTPPSLKGSAIFPGNIGGMAWGGAAFDPMHNLLIIPTTRLAAVIKLVPRADFKEERRSHLEAEVAEQKGAPYAMSRQFLLTPERHPCNAPPWGTLAAIDTKSGEKRWEVPLGEFAPGHPEFGSPNLGGPMVTAGNVIIIGAAFDSHLRGFDVETGKLLWTADLPNSVRANPMTYQGPDGKQYVVVSAGGHKGVNAIGDYVIAFALP
jgi:quinoprotein glucose dehydrogenase